MISVCGLPWLVLAFDRRNVLVACEPVASEAAADRLVEKIRQEGILAGDCPGCGMDHEGTRPSQIGRVMALPPIPGFSGEWLDAA
jgi:hypothetical protein